MMRRPTPLAQVYAWHRAALRGDAPAIHPSHPECGWFKRRLVKGGPWVPVRIYLAREIEIETGDLTGPEVIEADENGTRRDPHDIWTHLIPISRAEYEAMLFRPVMPITHDPRQPIDLTRSPIAWTL